jgi:hypothetical protein
MLVGLRRDFELEFWRKGGEKAEEPVKKHARADREISKIFAKKLRDLSFYNYNSTKFETFYLIGTYIELRDIKISSRRKEKSSGDKIMNNLTNKPGILHCGLY